MATSNPSKIITLAGYEDNIKELEELQDSPKKQDILTAGSGITITTTGSGKNTVTTISSTSSGGGSSSGGSNITIEVSGESPLSLNSTTSGDTVTIHGEITEATDQSDGYMTKTQVTQLNSILEDPLQYATVVTIEEIDALFD